MKSNIFQNLFRRFDKAGRPDYVLMTVFGILVLFGLAVLTSASSIYSLQTTEFVNAYRFIFHQILYGLLPGLFLFFIFYKIDYHFWLKLGVFWLIVSLVLLILVFIPGIGESHGRAQSWAKIGPISFQPSEAVKLTFLLYLAGWCYKRGRDKIADFSYGFVPFIFFLVLISGLIVAEPDVGTMLVIATTAALVYFLAGARISYLGWLGLAGVAGAVLLILKKTYLVNRWLVFLNPNADPQGTGYQISQALLAIGSGGWLGRGYGQSQQKFAYLPEVHADSIFAVIAEELGFIVVLLAVFLFFIIMSRGFKIAQNAPDEYGKLLAAGIVCWFTFQAFLNIAVISGLAPLTGIPLPFISFGGTALATSLGAAGLLLNISKQ